MNGTQITKLQLTHITTWNSLWTAKCHKVQQTDWPETSVTKVTNLHRVTSQNSEGLTLICLLGYLVTEHPLKGINVLVSRYTFFGYWGITQCLKKITLEQSEGYCRCLKFHLLSSSLNYLPADGRYLLHQLNTLFHLNEVTSHISDKEYALQSLVSPK